MFVVFVRHADPAAGGTDPGLSAPGIKRAAALAQMLAGAGITAVFTSEMRRTKDTAAPLAHKLGLAPVVVNDNPQTAANQIKNAGQCVLVVGHTNTVPQMIKALGGPPDVVIGADEFDRLLVLHVPANGAEGLLTMRYGE